jgi:hypothetical protein
MAQGDPEQKRRQFGPRELAQRPHIDADVRHRRAALGFNPALLTTKSAYAVRSTGAGGCEGLISANATCTTPPARPSATPMRQATV